MVEGGRTPAGSERSRDAETALRRLGYSKILPTRRAGEPDASFWVQEAGIPRRTFPVFVPPGEGPSIADGIDRWLRRGPGAPPRRAIFVAASDAAADEAWARVDATGTASVEHDVSILVLPGGRPSEGGGHFALRRIAPRELLRLATGVVVGMFRRSRDEDGAGSIDFGELLGLLRSRFGVDVQRSLGVRSDEDALFLLYQLAQRDSYAPGDAGSNVHLLVLKPTGPAARVPWFAG